MRFGLAGSLVPSHQSDTLITGLTTPPLPCCRGAMPRPYYRLLIGPNWLHMWTRVIAEEGTMWLIHTVKHAFSSLTKDYVIGCITWPMHMHTQSINHPKQ